MIPTLLVGDFILVNKFAFGLRDPVFHHKFLEAGKPQRGDVVVFRWPVDPSKDFIKRVIGLPGETIELRNKKVHVNGEPLEEPLPSRTLAPRPPSVLLVLTPTAGQPRVPVPDGSVVDLFARLGRDVSVADVHEVVRGAAEGPMKSILQFSDRPLVSTDIIGNSHSSIYDAEFTQVSGGRFIRVLNWYDNEWGYSSRVCDLLKLLKELG